jgi:DNA-binding XRE family transcriptional regulator
MSDPIPVRLTRVEADARIPLRRWGEAVLQARKTLWMSQAELADHVGVTQQTISKVELGTVVPSDRTKVRIAHAIGMHPGHLFGWWDPAGRDSPAGGAMPRTTSAPAPGGTGHPTEVG